MPRATLPRPARGARVVVVLAVLGAAVGSCRPSAPTIEIDVDLVPGRQAVGGLAGGPPRGVGVAAVDGERIEELVVGEVLVRASSEPTLQAFVDRHGGEVLSRPPSMVGGAAPPTAALSPWVLVRVDPATGDEGALPGHLESLGQSGRISFSSRETAQTAAIIARGLADGLIVVPNTVFYPTAVFEHPDDSGGNIELESEWWMNQDNDPGTPGEQGLSVGVVDAWRYLEHLGLPPTNGTWTPVRIAFLDAGFNLDETTGAPRDGNLDYFFFGAAPDQIDLIDFDNLAGGASTETNFQGIAAPWHGQKAFGVGGARPRNLYGTAGTSGEYTLPLLVRMDYTASGIADAIRTAAINRADVIVVNASGNCGFWCDAWELIKPTDDVEDLFDSSIRLATTFGSIVVAAAGNEGGDVDDLNTLPCVRDHVICAGSIFVANNGNLVTPNNFGRGVDIRAPTCVLSTVSPDSAALDGNDVGRDELPVFCGTSASTPFLGGVVALMKAADPTLRWDRAEAILVETANQAPGVSPGWVDARRAVERVRPNQPHEVRWNLPPDGSTRSHNREVYLHVDVTDPERPDGFRGEVVFSSNRDGELCTAVGFVTGCRGPVLSLGEHRLTAAATDSFDLTVAAEAQVTVINEIPLTRILLPFDNDVFSADQTINFRGYGFDWDEVIPESALVWTSDLDGMLGSGQEITADLSEGTHAISLTATDSLGQAGTTQISVFVLSAGGVPSVTIQTPASGSFVTPGDTTTLSASGTDPEDGTLPSTAFSWSSDIQGALGTGNPLDVVLDAPATPCHPEFLQHTLTVTATDSDGNSAQHTVPVLVGAVC